jgi:hypothetical protein
LRPLFYESVPLSAAPDRELARAMAVFMTDAFECIWEMAHSYGADDRAAWSEYFRFMYGHSPVLRETYDASPRSWYPYLSAWLTSQRIGSAAELAPLP